MIAYPEFTEMKKDDADPIRVSKIVKEILGGIASYDLERITSDERHNKIPDEGPQEDPAENLPF